MKRILEKANRIDTSPDQMFKEKQRDVKTSNLRKEKGDLTINNHQILSNLC